METTAYKMTETPDEDGRLTIYIDNNQPLVIPDCITLIGENNDVFLADVLDWHDCWMDGGEQSFLWVEVR